MEEKGWEPGEDYSHRGQKLSNSTHRSKTDPDARISRKSLNSGTGLYHAATYVMENRSRIIVGVGLGRPDKKTDCEEALREIRRIKWVHKMRPKSLGGDKGYGAGEFIHHLMEEGIDPHIPIADYRSRNERGIYRRERFELDREKDVVICPEGKVLKLWGIHRHSKQRVYRASVKDCGVCLKKVECTRDRARSVSYHIYEDSIDQVRQLHKTKGYRISQKMRKRVEELFREAKAFMGLGRAKFRRAKFLREQVLMTATAQNIKRMIKLLLKGGQTSGAMKVQQCPSLSLSHILMKLHVWLSQKFITMQFFDRSHFATT